MICRIIFSALLLTVTARAAELKGVCAAPVACNAVTVIDTGGHTTVTFSNGLGFSGTRIGGDGPLFFTDTIYSDGKAVQISPGSGQGCHFYFTDHGTFTQGWESRLVTIECDVRLQATKGKIRFDITRH
jgi:hypothetical protein